MVFTVTRIQIRFLDMAGQSQIVKPSAQLMLQNRRTVQTEINRPVHLQNHDQDNHNQSIDLLSKQYLYFQ